MTTTTERQESDLPKIGRPATNALAHIGYHRLNQVSTLSERELLAIHGVGPNRRGCPVEPRPSALGSENDPFTVSSYVERPVATSPRGKRGVRSVDHRFPASIPRRSIYEKNKCSDMIDLAVLPGRPEESGHGGALSSSPFTALAHRSEQSYYVRTPFHGV